MLWKCPSHSHRRSPLYDESQGIPAQYHVCVSPYGPGYKLLVFWPSLLPFLWWLDGGVPFSAAIGAIAKKKAYPDRQTSLTKGDPKSV